MDRAAGMPAGGALGRDALRDTRSRGTTLAVRPFASGEERSAQAVRGEELSLDAGGGPQFRAAVGVVLGSGDRVSRGSPRVLTPRPAYAKP